MAYPESGTEVRPLRGQDVAAVIDAYHLAVRAASDRTDRVEPIGGSGTVDAVDS